MLTLGEKEYQELKKNQIEVKQKTGFEIPLAQMVKHIVRSYYKMDDEEIED